MVSKNIILAGIPRSGTTLVCHLLNQLPDVLALVEPINMTEFLGQPNAEARKAYIDSFCLAVRQQAVDDGQITAKIISGGGTNTFNSDAHGMRRPSLIKEGVIDLSMPVSDDFKLVVKHPNAFSALLPELSQAYNCFAVIRNPLSVLASWNSLDHPLAQGRAPMAEAFDAELKTRLEKELDKLERQLILMDWYYQQYDDYLEACNIIRYEDVIASGGRALQCIDGTAVNLCENLANKNLNSLYSAGFMLQVLEGLKLNALHRCWGFYTLDELDVVCHQTQRN